ncbi:MAG: 4-hydroxy-tetrahydrodipicolinate reductase [Planctomycetia bacterium]
MTRIKVLFSGARGRMGQALLPGLRAAPGLEVVSTVDRGDDLVARVRETGAQVVVDFTTAAVAMENARRILASGAQGVVGTTGFSAADLDTLEREALAAGRGLCVAPNFALGMVLLQRCAEQLVRHFPRVEVIEAHHEAKADAPSGTALRTAERLARAGAAPGPGVHGEPGRGHDVQGVRVHSVRLPGLVARQDVVFGSAGEAVVLRHEAHSRECYLPGVLLAVRAMPGRTGLVRGLEPLLPGLA